MHTHAPRLCHPATSIMCPKASFYRTSRFLVLSLKRLLSLLIFLVLASGIFLIVSDQQHPKTPAEESAAIRSLLLTTSRLERHLPPSLPFYKVSATPVLSAQASPKKPKRETLKPSLTPFLVDTAGVATWIRLGFSTKQAQTIIRYREKSGGFRNKEHFQRCYAVSEEAYRRLAPYLLFSKKAPRVNPPTHKTLFPFDPDTASVSTFVALGFTAKQAQVLVNFRKSLGGSFGSPERFARSYVVDSARFEELKPYLRFSTQGE